MLIRKSKGKGMGGKRKRWRKERVGREGERDTAEIHKETHTCVLWTPPLCLLSGGSCCHDIFYLCPLQLFSSSYYKRIVS